MFLILALCFYSKIQYVVCECQSADQRSAKSDYDGSVLVVLIISYRPISISSTFIEVNT